MKKYSIVLVVVSFVLILTVSGLAQTGQTASENSVSDAAGGYNFVVPAGWTKTEADGGFALTNAARTVLVAVKAHNYQNFERFAADASLERDGLQLVGEVRSMGEIGKAFRAVKQTGQGTLVIDTVVLFSPHGGGAIIVGFSDRANEKTGAQAAFDVAQTIRFVKPRASAEGNQWQQFLRGKHLIFLQTSGSFSDRTDIYLCASGAFYYKTDSSGLSTGGAGDLSMVSGSGGRGTWSIGSRGGAQLVLQFENGSTRQYELTRRQSAGEVSLNGRRYFVQAETVCR